MNTRVMMACLVVVVAMAIGLPKARAAGCKDQKVVEDLWEAYDRNARAMGCAAPVKGPFQFMACVATAVGKVPVKIGDRMLGYWNSMAKGGWATIGPRMLGPTWEEGTLVGTSGRTFVTTAPANTGKATVVIRKTDGRVGTEVTVCATRKGEQPRVIWNFRIDNGKDNVGKEFKKDFTDVSDSFISINLDGKSVIPTDKFAYKVKMDAEPVKWDFGPITKGWADLHVHQAAELSSGGTMYYGSHTGAMGTALHSCNWQQHGAPFNVGKWDQYRHGSGYPSFADWPHHLDIGHQQVHATWLENAWKKGLRLMVVSAVNSEPGCRIFSVLHPRPGASCLDMPNINAQLDAFIKFDETHDWYEIAVDPWHARKIINDGKLAVVLSLESSHLFPAAAGDFIEQLDQVYAMGVRTLQPTHEVDSRFSGAAPWSGMFELLQTVKYPVDFNRNFIQMVTSQKPGFDYETRTRDGQTGKFNRVGLKPDGFRLIDAMVARNMPVDVAHMSTKATEEVHGHLLQKHHGYPMYMSHSRFGSLLVAEDAKKQQEFLTSEHQIDMIKQLGGMVGLRTGPQPIKARPGDKDDVVLLSKSECAGSTRSFRNLVAYGLKRGVPIALGTDFNGNTSMMGSRFKRGKTGCPGGGTPEDVAPPAGVGDEFVTHGLRHIGLVGDMIADLRSLDPAAATALDNSAEAYLTMWQRAWKLGGPGGGGGPGPMPVSDNQPQCKQDFECGEGKYCDKGWLTIGKNQCLPVKAICSGCSQDGQCGLGNGCKGVVGLQKCIKENALAMGASCCMNDQCQSGQCDDGKCTCKTDAHCGAGRYCDLGTLTIGKNQCVSFKAACTGCSDDKQCGPGSDCRGVIGFKKCIKPGALAIGARCCMNDQCGSGQCEKDVCVCSKDAHCPAGKKCKKPLGGQNRCE